ncbi:MAG: hypothetical protein J6V50_04770, partial [Clostridia bacterium]|nr:hypothetical protein [Clostridia bacterium]
MGNIFSDFKFFVCKKGECFVKRTFYKTVVSFLSIAILLSSVYCVFVNAETAQTASGLKDEVYIDFYKYSVTYTKDKPTWGNVYGGFGEDFYQVKTDDETATGGAYLRLNKTATTAATCKVANQVQFLLNETGNFGWDVQNPGDADR